MAATSTSRQLEDILTCCLCLEFYDTTVKVPKALPCLHTFCVSCIDECSRAADENGQQLSCPKCKTRFVIPQRGAIDLPTNFSVQDMLQLNLHKTEVYGEGKSQGRISNSKDTENMPLTCNEHPSKHIMMVCLVCEVGLCTECIMKSLHGNIHGTHMLNDIDAYLSDFRHSLKSVNLRSCAIPTMINEFQQTCERKIADLQSTRDKEIDKKAEHAIQQAKKWQMSQKEASKSLSDKNRSFAKSSINGMWSRNEAINEKISKIKSLFSAGKLPCMSHVRSVEKMLKLLELNGEDVDGTIKMKVTDKKAPDKPEVSSIDAREKSPVRLTSRAPGPEPEAPRDSPQPSGGFFSLESSIRPLGSSKYRDVESGIFDPARRYQEHEKLYEDVPVFDDRQQQQQQRQQAMSYNDAHQQANRNLQVQQSQLTVYDSTEEWSDEESATYTDDRSERMGTMTSKEGMTVPDKRALESSICNVESGFFYPARKYQEHEKSYEDVPIFGDRHAMSYNDAHQQANQNLQVQ